MSEAMSSADIENVLSSIRRLVTDELRPRPAGAPPAEAEASATPDAPAVPERLLLTPALRVVESEPAPRPAIDGLVSLISAHVAPPPAGFEAETGDAFVAAEETPLRPVPPAEPSPGQPAAVAAVRSDGPAVPPAAATPRHETPKAVADWGPTRASAGGPAEDRPAADRLSADRPTGAPLAASRDDDDDEDEEGGPPPVVDLDEETLRELIRDVLREELQGPMGERMTRNIRKLVRAELARAMAVRTLS